jgi:hypothetical protein
LLSTDLRDDLETELERVIDGASFFQRENPFVRHVVLRKRATLESQGLLDKIAVNIHPEEGLVADRHRFNALFQGIALRTTPDFDRAYEEARAFGRVLAKRGKGGGFMKNLMEQRVCSSVVAGINTATVLLEGREVHEETEDVEADLAIQTDAERAALKTLIAALQAMKADPKLQAIRYYLKDEGWLSLGCIIFSQYYDTARWVADSLAAELPGEIIGLYAGADRSRLYRDGQAVGIAREALKRMVADHDIRLMVATDAACEGLNLQTLGTLINVDLPWNPTRLEQRIGRIKRFGQARSTVDMLNSFIRAPWTRRSMSDCPSACATATTCSAVCRTPSKTTGSTTWRPSARRWTSTSKSAAKPLASTYATTTRSDPLQMRGGTVQLCCRAGTLTI